jgi:hypothetical protein
MECAVKLFLQYVRPSTACTIEKDSIQKESIQKVIIQQDMAMLLSPQANTYNKVHLSKALMSLSGFGHPPSQTSAIIV